MKILITGGAGFIGSRLTKALLQTFPEAQVLIYDNLLEQVHGPHAKFPLFPSSVTCIKADIQNKVTFESSVKDFKPTHVYHLAAETGTSQSMDEIQRYCEVNIQGTAILVEALTKHVPQLQQLILASSRAVYGEGPWKKTDSSPIVIPQPRTQNQIDDKIFNPLSSTGEELLIPMPATEETPAQPSSIYASTKLMQEYIVLQSKLKNCSLIFRFQNVYGAGQSLRNPYTGVLSIFTSQMLQKKQIEVFEDGHISRDFVHVDDIVSGLVLGLQKNITHGEIINLGAGEPTTILNAARMILDCSDSQHVPVKVSGQFRPGDIRFACANTHKAKTLLGWSPQVKFIKGIQELVNWSRIEIGQ